MGFVNWMHKPQNLKNEQVVDAFVTDGSRGRIRKGKSRFWDRARDFTKKHANKVFAAGMALLTMNAGMMYAMAPQSIPDNGMKSVATSQQADLQDTSLQSAADGSQVVIVSTMDNGFGEKSVITSGGTVIHNSATLASQGLNSIVTNASAVQPGYKTVVYVNGHPLHADVTKVADASDGSQKGNIAVITVNPLDQQSEQEYKAIPGVELAHETGTSMKIDRPAHVLPGSAAFVNEGGHYRVAAVMGTGNIAASLSSSVDMSGYTATVHHFPGINFISQGNESEAPGTIMGALGNAGTHTHAYKDFKAPAYTVATDGSTYNVSITYGKEPAKVMASAMDNYGDDD